MVLGLYFLIVIALPLALGSYVVYNGLPHSRRCPTCADETLRLKSIGHDLVSRLIRRNLHSRWCMSCGWRGTARMALAPPLPAWSTSKPKETKENEGRGTNGRTNGRVSPAGANRLELRTLHVDGDPWRVMVECWAEGGGWLARLVFVAPGGKVCADQKPLEGESVLAVLSQAFNLPERTLAGRLRSLR